MVTKCDLVDGFSEYFDDLRTEGRAQVWGVTFPYAQSVANEGPGVFPAEFDALMARLKSEVASKLADAHGDLDVPKMMVQTEARTLAAGNMPEGQQPPQ